MSYRRILELPDPVLRSAHDLTALDQARKFCGPHEVEVWDGARFVSRVKPDGTASDVTPKGPRAD